MRGYSRFDFSKRKGTKQMHGEYENAHEEYEQERDRLEELRRWQEYQDTLADKDVERKKEDEKEIY